MNDAEKRAMRLGATALQTAMNKVSPYGNEYRLYSASQQAMLIALGENIRDAYSELAREDDQAAAMQAMETT